MKAVLLLAGLMVFCEADPIFRPRTELRRQPPQFRRRGGYSFEDYSIERPFGFGSFGGGFGRGVGGGAGGGAGFGGGAGGGAAGGAAGGGAGGAGFRGAGGGAGGGFGGGAGGGAGFGAGGGAGGFRAGGFGGGFRGYGSYEDNDISAEIRRVGNRWAVFSSRSGRPARTG